jgi:ribosome recycling factor
MPVQADAKGQMEKALEAMRRDFGSVRTGKASSALLDQVRVEAYGSKMPLNQVATVSSPEARMLVIQPWDKGMLNPIEKAIRDAGLGLNPANDGNLVRVPIPALNEERRKELVKMLHKLAEEGRVAVRHARQESNKTIKQKQSDGDMSEDDARREMEKIQKLTDEYIAKVDQMLKSKEEEVMEV